MLRSLVRVQVAPPDEPSVGVVFWVIAVDRWCVSKTWFACLAVQRWVATRLVLSFSLEALRKHSWYGGALSDRRSMRLVLRPHACLTLAWPDPCR
jgi:hypothetical protein